MKTATRLLCTALLASLGIGLAQAAPLTGANGPNSKGNGNAPDLEYGYCSPDSEKITGFARCDSKNDRGSQNARTPQLDLVPGDEQQDWQDWPLGPQYPGESSSRLRIDVPEPPALALLGLGLVALGMGRRRTQRRN